MSRYMPLSFALASFIALASTSDALAHSFVAARFFPATFVLCAHGFVKQRTSSHRSIRCDHSARFSAEGKSLYCGSILCMMRSRWIKICPMAAATCIPMTTSKDHSMI